MSMETAAASNDEPSGRTTPAGANGATARVGFLVGVRTLRRLLQGESGTAAAAQSTVATLLVIACNVVTGVVTARLLGPQGRGELSALLLAPQVLGFLFTLGLPAAVIVLGKRHRELQAGLVGAALLLSVLMGVFAAGAGSALLPMLLEQYGESTVTVARMLLVFVWVGVPSTVLIATLQLRERFGAFNRLRYVQGFAVLVALLVLAATGPFRPNTAALAYLLPTLPFVLWNAGWAAREFRPSLNAFGRQCRRLLSFGARVHGIDVVSTLLAQLDKVILVAVLAPAAFGIYIVAFNLSRLVATFANSAVPVLLPRSAGRPLPEVLAVTGRALSAVVLLTLGVVIGFALLGGVALRVLYGAAFAHGYVTLLILSVEAALFATASILQQPYLVLDRPGTVAVIQSAGLAVAVPLVYVLGTQFGIAGAAAGLCSGTIVRLVLTHRGYRRLLGVAPPPLVPTRSDCARLIGWQRAGVGG
jgi:O-antigen/teichoic acid export membrane protein